MMAGSSQGPSISTFQGLDSWSFRPPSQHHLHQTSPTLTLPPTSPDQLSRISSNRSLKAKSTSGVPPLDADAIVQAANPAHPDHRLWVERFGTASRRKKGADGASGTGPYKAKSLRGDPTAVSTGSHSNLSHLAPGSSSVLPASPVAASAQSHNRSQSGHASSSASSSEGAPSRSASPSRRMRRRPVSHAHSEQRSREDQQLPLNAVGAPSANGGTLAERRQRSKRKKPRDRNKGKAKAPTPPLPPPRVSSSSLHQPPPGSEPSTPLTPLSPTSMQHIASGAAIDGVYASGPPTTAGAKEPPQTQIAPTRAEKQADSTRAEAFVFPSNGTPASREGEFVEEIAGTHRAARPQNGDGHPPQHRSQWIRQPGSMSSSLRTQNESISSSCFPESTTHSRNGSSSNMGQDSTAHSSSFRTAFSTSQHSGSGQHAHTLSSQSHYQAPPQPRVRQSLDSRRPVFPEPRFPSMRDIHAEPSRRTRSTSMDLLRESFSLTPRKGSGPIREDVTASGGRGTSRIRASMDAVRPRFLTSSRSGSAMSAYPDDLSETSSSMANTSGFRKRLNSLKSSLRKASGGGADKNAGMKASSSIPSIMTSSDLSSGQTTPNRYRPRATQSMDIPRRPVPRFDEFTPPVPPLPPSLPPLAEHRTLSPPTLGGGPTPRPRLSLVGEETEEGTEFFDAKGTDDDEQSLQRKDQMGEAGVQSAQADEPKRTSQSPPEVPPKEDATETLVEDEGASDSRWQHPFASAAARNSVSDSPHKATFEERWRELASRDQANASRASHRQPAEFQPSDPASEHSHVAAFVPTGQTSHEANGNAQPNGNAPPANPGLPRLNTMRSYDSSTNRSASDRMPFGSIEQGLASSSTVQHTSTAGDTPAKPRSKGRLAGLWSRARKDRGKPQTPLGSERVGSPASFASSSVMPPSVSHGSVQTADTSSQHPNAYDETTETLDDSHDFSSMSMGMAGLGIQAPSEPLPPTGGWRSRVSSIASARSSRRARQFSDHKVPVPPLPSTNSQGSHLAEGEPDEAWRRNLLAEAVGLSFNHQTAATPPGETAPPQAQQSSGARGNGLSPNGAVSNGSAVNKGKRSPFLEVVAAGRKSFSRDRVRPATESQPELPTIHKSLSPALLSETQKVGSDDGTSVDGEAEAWDGMDDERETVLTVGARKVPFVHPALEGIQEQDSMSQGSRSPTSSTNDAGRSLQEQQQQQQSTIGSMAVRLVRPSTDGDADSDIITTIDSDFPGGLSAGSPSPASKSFSEKRASLGKHATPPNLQLSPPQETLENLAGGRDDEADGRDRDLAPSPSPSFGRRTPRSARFPFISKGGSSPSLPRTSFSTDRDRAPVASPYVPHASSPRPGALRGAFKKFTSSPISPALRSFSGSKGIGKGISSEHFRGVDDHGDYDEVLADPSPGQMPWDDSLAAAQAATRLLQAHTETLLPSPAGTPLTATPSRTGTSSSHESGNAGSGSGQKNVGLGVGPIGNSPIDRSFTSSPKSFARNIEPASPAIPGYRTPPIRPPRNRTASSTTSASGGRGTPLDANASVTSLQQARRPTGGSSPPSGLSAPAAANPGLTSPELSAFEAMLRAQKSREEETLRNISARTGLAARPQGTAQ